MKHSLRILALVVTSVIALLGCKPKNAGNTKYIEHTNQIHGFIISHEKCDSVWLAARNLCVILDSSSYEDLLMCRESNRTIRNKSIKACTGPVQWFTGANGKPIRIQITDPECINAANSEYDKQDAICQAKYRSIYDLAVKCITEADNARNNCIPEKLPTIIITLD